MDAADIEAKTKEVEQFLEEFRKTAGDRRPVVIGREKNLKILIDLGLTLNDQAAILFGLTALDYVSGPDRDRDRPGFVWVFGKVINRIEIYIKLKITEYTPVDSSLPIREAKCISFHPAERPMVYPLKQ